jgi:integrase
MRHACLFVRLAARRANGGELEQIGFLLGHSSIQTIERYLGPGQRIASAFNENLEFGETEG